MKRIFSVIIPVLLSLFVSHVSQGQSVLKCDNWLQLTQVGTGVRVGDIDVVGDQLTVEGIFMRTALPWDTATHGQGDIVSKQIDPQDVNYLLRADHAELTTTNGFVKTPPTCPIESNKTYHVAMVYDGKTLKYYRNGFLMSQVTCTGNMITNNWITTIGEYAHTPGKYGTALIGYINEVRIWKVARTQAEIRNNMASSLTNPAAEPGLVAYYRFDDLQNKQGNSAWNGTLLGNPSINATNPLCPFVADSCVVASQDAIIGFTMPDSICSGGSIQIENTSINALTNEWAFCSGGDASLCASVSLSSANTFNPPAVRYGEKGEYYIKLTINKGLKDEQQMIKKLVVTDIIEAILPADTTVCANNFIINSKINNPLGIYSWSTGTSNSSTTVSGSGTYWLEAFATDGCRLRDTIKVTLLPPIHFSLGTDRTICKDVSLQLTGPVGMQYYKWSSNSNTQSIVVNQAGVYSLTVGNGSCTFSDTVIINNFPQLNFDLGKDTAFCNGEALTIGSELASVSGYSWSNGASSPSIDIVQPGKYWVDIIDNNSCKYTDTIQVTTDVKPVFDLGDIVTLCKGTAFQFISPVVADSYKWNTGTTVNSIQVSRPGIYWLEVKKGTCSAADTINVTEQPLPEIAASDTSFCKGESVVISAGQENLSYTWSTGSFEHSISISDTGTFWVEVKEKDCTARKEFKVTYKGLPAVMLGPDQYLCGASPASVIPSITNGQFLSWNDDFPTAARDFKTVGMYVLVAQNNCGVSMDTINVLNGIRSKSGKLMPNSFSPNGDGKNECFGGKVLGPVQKFELTIWNRWGQQVFHSTDSTDCWDGNLNGRQAPSGEYVYVVRALTACGIVNEKSLVLLVR